MVEQVITYIMANWVAWLFAGAYAILIALYKKEKQQQELLFEDEPKRGKNTAAKEKTMEIDREL